ncbi:hypothetical protein V5J35_000689 [Endozoicomonas sp. NE40]|uniref:Uncharacterized protein n=1 Tax=Endozoicomonas lisbonensis TaxID=3120522 RepID=A0ABV2SCK7_9GAMM
MQWLFKSGLFVLLVQAVNAFSAPAACWQSSTTEAPPDGRLCVAFTHAVPDSTERVFYGRSALDLGSVSNGSIKHFCAIEAGGEVRREKTYFWLHGKEEKVRAAVQKEPIVINAADSPDQSEKRKLELGKFIKRFEYCDARDKPTDQQQAEMNTAETKLCIKSTDNKTLDFGTFSRSGKCKVFDATLSDKKPSLPLYELAEKARRLKELSHPFVHAAWAGRQGEPFASHSPYGVGYDVDYCILQAFIRGHQYCSVDYKGRYQTGKYINYEDQYDGKNYAYEVLYIDLQPDSKAETTSRVVDEIVVDEVTVDEVTVDEVTVDKVTVDKVTVDKVTVDKVTVDEVTVDEVVDGTQEHQDL